MAEKKEKRYVSDNAQLMVEWDWDRNAELDPTQLTLGSNKKVWWKCVSGHEWEAKIANRNLGKGCPYCSGRYAIKGENDLQTVNPTLSKEWNYEKNNGLTPADVLPNSNLKVWWQCSRGHEWQANVSDRHRGHGCIFCAGQKVIVGENDLQTINPQLAAEWNYEKNAGLSPSDVMPGSNKKVWWICRKGHEWSASVNSRNRGNGCPMCSSEQNTSFPEYALVYYLQKYDLDVVHSYKDQGYELDVYIPSQRIAIEYDGYYWHRDKVKQDLDKNQRCKNDGIKLYRVREGLPPLDDSSIDYVVHKSQKDLAVKLAQLLTDIIGAGVIVDFESDNIAIENLREYSEKENSVIKSAPMLAREWHYAKNGNLKPENFAANSGKKVWWKCNNGHEWQATIDTRNKGHGCPYCAGQKVFKSYNDLGTISPHLALEWNYAKNNGLSPADVIPGSGKKVWWQCSKGHEWRAAIKSRHAGCGCPYCSGRVAIKGYNDLQTINPDLAKEWNYEKNNGLTPADVLLNSNKKVWWQCSDGHEWQATINHRSRGNGCPYCLGRNAIKGKNDLQTINPDLALEWNYEKNDGLAPADVLPGSHKKVWWQCSDGHEWQAVISSRTKGNGCPYCAGKKVLKGYNDLDTVNPELALEWNYEKNDGLTPADVLPGSHSKVWWKCNEGHEWQAVIANRNKGHGCPQCYHERRKNK